MKKTKAPPSPLDLLFMLADSCMHKVSPEAWKIISYVAVQHIRVYPEYLERLKSPLARQWNLDVESRGMINILPDASDGNERPYRPWNGPGLPQTDSGPRGVVLSVQQIRNGLRTKRRWRDHGTGLADPQLTRPSKRPRQLEFWFANAGTSKAKMWRVCTGSNGTVSKTGPAAAEESWPARETPKIGVRPADRSPGLELHLT